MKYSKKTVASLCKDHLLSIDRALYELLSDELDGWIAIEKNKVALKHLDIVKQGVDQVWAACAQNKWRVGELLGWLPQDEGVKKTQASIEFLVGMFSASSLFEAIEAHQRSLGLTYCPPGSAVMCRPPDTKKEAVEEIRWVCVSDLADALGVQVKPLRDKLFRKLKGMNRRKVSAGKPGRREFYYPFEKLWESFSAEGYDLTSVNVVDVQAKLLAMSISFDD